MHDPPCYEVEFDDGTIIVAEGQHQWLTWTRPAARGGGQHAGEADRDGEHVAEVVTTEQMAAGLGLWPGGRSAGRAVPVCRPLRLPAADPPLPPYALGARVAGR